MEPRRSKRAKVAGFLEDHLERSVLIGIRGTILAGIGALGYLVIGGLLVLTGSPLGPTEFLSLEGDPLFYISISLVALFIVQATGSLILYQFLTGVEDQRSQFVILMSYIGLGFGGAALRFTLPQSIEFLFTIL